MRVCLITEGTYPVHPGGVSDWCDQLVRGLPEVEFSVVALTGSGREPARYASPSNLVAVERVGLWADPPRRRRARPADHRLVAAYAHLLEAVLRDAPITWFTEACARCGSSPAPSS
ncbi:hypothetical protein GCM10023215_06450 [Pseudonocardia yuanmonensis]|uniref:DUF3492 domain-containing protein n=1 Tax=Pseudonocardia yuanmonensis TaxID=1095914 RepID=A0ABP8W2J1_9PSEU